MASLKCDTLPAIAFSPLPSCALGLSSSLYSIDNAVLAGGWGRQTLSQLYREQGCIAGRRRDAAPCIIDHRFDHETETLQTKRVDLEAKDCSIRTENVKQEADVGSDLLPSVVVEERRSPVSSWIRLKKGGEAESCISLVFKQTTPYRKERRPLYSL